MAEREQPRAARLPAGGVVRARRGDADLRRAGRGRQGGVHADAARAPLLGVHLAGAALQGRRDQRDDDPLHAGRPALRLRRAAREDAPGAALDAATARKIAEDARRDAVERRPRAVRAGRAGPGAPAGGPRRPHVHLRAAPDPRRGPLPAAAGRVRRSPHRGDATSSGSPRRSRAATTSMRSANTPSASARRSALVLLYVVGGIGVGLFFMLRALRAVAARRRSGASRSAFCRRSRRSTSGR